MNPDLIARITRARELLATAHNLSLATVNPDGSPHNTPLFFAIDNTLQHMVWSSHPDSLHSQNITRTGQAFGVIYEASQGGGLYMRLANGQIVTDLKSALTVYNSRRKELDRQQVPPQQFTDSPQQLYSADITELWVNISERNAQGLTIRDYRHKITASELLT